MRIKWNQSFVKILTYLIVIFTITSCVTTKSHVPSETMATGYEQNTKRIKQYSIEEFLETETYYWGATFSPDNSKLLVSSDKTGIVNAFAIPVDGSKPVQLTRSKKNAVYTISYFPESEKFLYTSDENGNELYHIYIQNPDGSVKDLTPGDSVRAKFVGWAGQQQSFFISTNERDPHYFDLYKISTNGYKRTDIFKNTNGYTISKVSPNGRFVALTKINTNADSDIYVYDVKTDTTRLLTKHTGSINFEPQAFSNNSSYLYYLTNKDSEFQYLVKHNLETDKVQTVKKYNWDIMYANISADGTYLVIGINENAQTNIEIFKTKTMERVATPKLPNASINSVSISNDENAIAFYASNSKMPGDLFTYKMKGNPKPHKLTHSLNKKINPDDLVPGKTVRFNSYDGVEIPGILYKPHQASADNKVPALVWVHGGPGLQSKIGYSALIQYLVNHGYAIYAINNRGSSGYGKTFYHMDDRKHGEADLDDCVASKKMLIDTGYIKPKKIGIIGRSYGGYMTLAALAFRPREFAVGIDLFGISNWYRTLHSYPDYWERFKSYLEKEMGDLDNKEFFKKKSPLFHADSIVNPLMVLQGANDPRVLKAESDDIVEAVRQNNVPVEYMVFQDEGHGFEKQENRIEGYKAILEFLNRYLKMK